MSQFLWCEDCGTEQKKQEGSRRVYIGGVRDEEYFGSYMEPDEYERVVWGRARLPNPDDRFMLINGAAFPLPTDHYICDSCGAEIWPGAKCLAWTIWRADHVEPTPWEDSYLERKD